MVVFVLLAAALIASSSIAEPQFRKDYNYEEQQNAFYKAHRFPRSWYDAYKQCDMEGAVLVYPASEEEVTLVTEMMSDYFWVGAHDLLGRGVFLDLKGNDIAAQREQIRWVPEIPDRNLGTDCIRMHPTRNIYNEDCESLHPFVCKRLAQNITYNAVCDTWDEAYFVNKDFKSCYKFHTTPKTWTDAFLTCHAEQSHLAIIDDKEEADFITKGVKAVAEDVRGDYVKDFIAVGYHDKFEEGNYVTLQGQSLDTVYNEWDKGEPNNMYGQEDCGTVKTNGLLNDFNCNVQRILFVCERNLSGSDLNGIY